LAAVDSNTNDTFTFALVSGNGDTDNALFVISGNELKANVSFDYEKQAQYSIRVRVTDSSSNKYEKIILVHVTNVNEAPTKISLSANVLVENAAIDKVVGTLTATDVDYNDTVTFTLVSGDGDADNGAFAVENGALVLKGSLNYEADSNLSVRVRVTDSNGLSAELELTVQVTNVNEAPTAATISQDTVNENVVTGSVVGTLSANDSDFGDTFTWMLVSGTGSDDNTAFVIEGNTLKTVASFNYERQSTYSIRVRVTDAAGLAYEKVWTITISDVNEAPSGISLSGDTLPENKGVGATVGTLSGTDEDSSDSLSFTLVRGDGDTDNASFTIDGTALKAAENFDYDTKSSYSIRVRLTDSGGLTYEKQLTISVTDVVENTAPSAPTGLANGDAKDRKVTLTWNAATDDKVGTITYKVYANSILLGTTTSLQYEITGLNSNSLYIFYVVAVDSENDESNASATVTLKTEDVVPPSVPQNLTVTGVTPTSISYSWSPSTDDINLRGYIIFVDRLVGGVITPTFTTGNTTNKTTFTLTGLTLGRSYTVRVKAYDFNTNTGNQSDFSDPVTATTADSTPPTQPGGLTVSNTTENSATISWTASSDNVGVQGYSITVNGVYLATTKNTSYTISGLSPATSYSVEVKAFDATKNFSTGAAVSALTQNDTTVPSQPGTLTVTGTTSSSVTVNWTASTDNVGVSGYAVFVNGKYLATTKNTSYTVSGLFATTSYNIEIKAFDNAKNFSTGATDSATTQNDTGAPTTPTDLTFVSSTKNSITVSWTASTDNVALQGYAIYRNGKYLATTKNTSYTLTGLTANTAYSISVRAYDRAQNFSGYSSALSTSTTP
jgi:hypothetical protein